MTERKGILKATLTIDGHTISAVAEMGEAALAARGPMSLESGLMGLVNKLAHEIYRQHRGLPCSSSASTSE